MNYPVTNYMQSYIVVLVVREPTVYCVKNSNNKLDQLYLSLDTIDESGKFRLHIAYCYLCRTKIDMLRVLILYALQSRTSQSPTK